MNTTKGSDFSSLEYRLEAYEKAMEIREERGWGPARISQEVGINKNTVAGWIYRDVKPDRGLSGEANLNPSPELSYIIGVYKGDGSAHKVSYRNCRILSLTTTDLEFIEEFNRCLTAVMSKRGGYSVTHLPQEREEWKDKYMILGGSNDLINFLENSNEHKKTIDEYPSEFLRGIYDSEGWKDDRSRIAIGNTDRQLLTQVRNMVKNLFDLNPSLYKAYDGDKREGAEKDNYRLLFNKGESLRFSLEINPTIPRRRIERPENIVKCTECGALFESEIKMRNHRGQVHGDTRYRNEKWLRHQYIDKDRTMREIARVCNCSGTTIRNWLKKYGIRR